MFKLNFNLALSLAAISAVFYTSTVIAECIPSDDPCAPKKKIGEWNRSASFGFNFTDGNSNTTLVNLGAAANLERDNNIFESSLSYNFGEDDDTDDPENGSTTRNDFRIGAQYNHLLNERSFIGIGSKVLYDEIADVDYRVNIDPTAGYYLLKDNSFKFRLEAGPSYVFEKQGREENDYLAPRIADRFEWAITCTSKLYQSAEILGDIDDSDNYLVNAEVGVEAALDTNLSLVFKLVELYDNVPAQDRERNDLQAITALKIAL